MQPQPRQPERISDHADRRQRHGRRTQHRRQQDAEHRIEHARCHRNPPGVVEEREYKVPDVAWWRATAGPPKLSVAAQEVMPALSMATSDAHGNADIRSCQCRASLMRRRPRHHPALAAQRSTSPCAWQDIGLDLGDGVFATASRCHVVAGQHDNAQTVRATASALQARWASRISNGDDA